MIPTERRGTRAGSGGGSGGLVAVTNWRDRSHRLAGGAEVCCEEVACRLASAGHQVVLLCAAVKGSPRREVRDGFTVIRRGGRFSVYPWALLWLLVHRRSLEAVIDSQNGIPFFTPLAVRRRTPVVLLLHHIHQQQFAQYFPSPVAAIGRWLERTGSRWVYRDRVIAAVSPSTRTGARRELGLKGPIFVVPPGFAGRSLCRGEAQPCGSPRALHFVGDGPARADLEELARTEGVSHAVHFHGSLPASLRDDMLATAWVTVNASQGEGWGLSVIEANALGVPAIAFDVAGLRDSVRHGLTGWLVPEGGDLGNAILLALDALESPAERQRWAERPRRWAASFDWDHTAKLLESILQTEGSRLEREKDRRLRSDLAMVVRLPAELIPKGWTPGFRSTDRLVDDGSHLSVLLPGADSDTASAALRRAGIPGEVLTDARTVLRVARPSDHIVPAMSTLATEPALLGAFSASSLEGHSLEGRWSNHHPADQESA